MTCGVIGNTTDFGSVESKFEPWQVNNNQIELVKFKLVQVLKLSCGVIGNTSDSGSEEFRFETWQDNKKRFHLKSKACKSTDLQAFLFFIVSM